MRLISLPARGHSRMWPLLAMQVRRSLTFLETSSLSTCRDECSVSYSASEGNSNFFSEKVDLYAVDAGRELMEGVCQQDGCRGNARLVDAFDSVC